MTTETHGWLVSITGAHIGSRGKDRQEEILHLPHPFGSDHGLCGAPLHLTRATTIADLDGVNRCQVCSAIHRRQP